MMTTQLVKHHGLGNDFLITFADRLPLDASARALQWCDRHRGIGADGLIYGLPGENGGIAMRLINSDGSAAEISGNGLRCFAHAIARSRNVAHLEIEVETVAGDRTCLVRATDDLTTVMATVDLGLVCPGPDPDVTDLVERVSPLTGPIERWETAEIGNPHIVVQVPDPFDVILSEAGPAVEAHFPGGINVHFVARTGDDEITLRVWERGAGITEACGSGAAVAASVLHNWGEVGPMVNVAMPGGSAYVVVGDPIKLSGPSTFVAEVQAVFNG